VLVRPSDAFVSGHRKLLILVSSITGVYLHFGAICGRAAGYIKTLVVVDGQGACFLNPSLGSSFVTRFDDDSGSVNITSSRKTGRRALSRVDDMTGRGGIGWGWGCGCARIDNLPFLVSARSARPNLRLLVASKHWIHVRG
jgi:hypothetical protein